MKTEKFFIYKFSSEDLCVSKGGKILLLDKHINWTKQFSLVSGEQYIIENPIIRELEKCRIITGGTFINVGYFPTEVDVWGGPYIYNDKISFNASRVIKYKESQISSEKIEGLEFPAIGDLSEEIKGLLGLLPQKYQEMILSFRTYIEWIKKESLTILEVGKDFEKNVGYKVISTSEFIDPKSINQSFTSESSYGEPRLSKNRKSIYEEIFFDGRKGGEKEKIETIEYLKLSDSGFVFSFSPIALCPTGQLGKLIVEGYEYRYNIKFPGDGISGSYLQFAKEINWLTEPPVLLKSQDCEWLEKGGGVCFSERSEEFYIGSWDGTNYIWDMLPAGFLAQGDEPENPKGWVLVHYPCKGIRYIFDPNFSDLEYLRKVEESRIRTLAFENLKANGKYSQYSYDAILREYFFVEEVDIEIDFLYGYGWTYGYLSQSSYNRAQGILFQEGVSNGFDIRKSLEEVVGEFKFIIPIDGSGVYLRIPKESNLYGKVRFVGLVKKIREKLDELYPSVGWHSGWDSNILDSLIRDVEKLNFNENDINTFEEKVLNLYQIQKSLNSTLRGSLEEALKNTFVEFVSEEISEIYKSIEVSSEETENISIKNLQKKFAGIKEKINKLPEISKNRKGIHDTECVQKRFLLVNQAEQMGIDEHLLDIFDGDLVRASQFMSNVSKIETWRLDANELSCGRSRARSVCEDAWSITGEITDFFCGANPNDVKYYVYEYHFGENAKPVVHREEKGSYNKNLSTSNEAMAEALRKAGLVY